MEKQVSCANQSGDGNCHSFSFYYFLFEEKEGEGKEAKEKRRPLHFASPDFDSRLKPFFPFPNNVKGKKERREKREEAVALLEYQFQATLLFYFLS